MTNAGLLKLAGCGELESLTVGGGGVTDDAFETLLKLPRLKAVNAGKTSMSWAAADRFRAARPDGRLQPSYTSVDPEEERLRKMGGSPIERHRSLIRYREKKGLPTASLKEELRLLERGTQSGK